MAPSKENFPKREATSLPNLTKIQKIYVHRGHSLDPLSYPTMLYLYDRVPGLCREGTFFTIG